jgi:hypothetical protein
VSLARFFEEIAPTLLGETPAEKSAPALGVDPKRLAVYERFCRVHRFETVEGLFPHCRAAVDAALWPTLVEDYFRRFPMRSVELNSNGEKWPEFLATEAASRALPAWLPELADFEWWEWQTLIAPNETEDPRKGPLRLAGSLEIRPYRYDLLGWIEEGRQGEPDEAANYVLFWRDPELNLRREAASPLELWVIKSVATGEPLTGSVLKKLKLKKSQVDGTLADLREAGILLGG